MSLIYIVNYVWISLFPSFQLVWPCWVMSTLVDMMKTMGVVKAATNLIPNTLVRPCVEISRVVGLNPQWKSQRNFIVLFAVTPFSVLLCKLWKLQVHIGNTAKHFRQRSFSSVTLGFKPQNHRAIWLFLTLKHR